MTRPRASSVSSGRVMPTASSGPKNQTTSPSSSTPSSVVSQRLRTMRAEKVFMAASMS